MGADLEETRGPGRSLKPNTPQAAAQPRPGARRLIVTADDFGRSTAINEAVIQAYQQGILTTASLMVNGAAFKDAADLARNHPGLGVGLHLTLVCGASTLKPTEIPDLIDRRYQFSSNPVLAGLRYFFLPRLRSQLRHEIDAQFRKFRQTGFELDHVNGHLNLHLHPTILSLLLRHSRDWGVRRMRLTRDPFWLNARLAPGRWLYRSSHAAIFAGLSRRAAPALRQHGIGFTQRVFGLLQNGRLTETYLMKLAPELPQGDCELYSHPSIQDATADLEALTSPRVRELLDHLEIRRIRYQDL